MFWLHKQNPMERKNLEDFDHVCVTLYSFNLLGYFDAIPTATEWKLKDHILCPIAVAAGQVEI